jgi:hypothetical protein
VGARRPRIAVEFSREWMSLQTSSVSVVRIVDGRDSRCDEPAERGRIPQPAAPESRIALPEGTQCDTRVA